ncbi:MAG: RluA family pseudouridine synthase [Deltaproteobacteria bacterium]|nr:RluA family pseudouridine synthase [Deltaproteobacteria bacterium]MBW1923000.1 RluA family pseudouridine synthase [Deltaproteobacteria bacterium]MBW1950112.1 RluA family pseudouridine synthase [Deltaproteobacteria bacterium]MBW2008797.1 RluA family pseudouridine synthase [Deltaproteobacteria bacterium]MBW2103572.1 RluA family pseudouridine synthase [Deltaproteobacteria bacterium]
MVFSKSSNIEILYEDNHLLALFKPAGLLVQGDRTGDPSLLDWAREYIRDRYEKPGRVFIGLVHRLDRPVPGVVLTAKTSKAAARLSEQFRQRTIRKVYWAVVRGIPARPEGRSVVYLERQGKRVLLVPPGRSGAKRAELCYRTLETIPGHALLHVDLLTGRHHQVRAQLAALGHPIVGDARYGRSRGGERLGLLARSLSFRHPTRDLDLTVEAPCPADWPWPP